MHFSFFCSTHTHTSISLPTLSFLQKKTLATKKSGAVRRSGQVKMEKPSTVCARSRILPFQKKSLIFPCKPPYEKGSPPSTGASRRSQAHTIVIATVRATQSHGRQGWTESFSSSTAVGCGERSVRCSLSTIENTHKKKLHNLKRGNVRCTETTAENTYAHPFGRICLFF